MNIVDIGKALSNRTRTQLLFLLTDGPKSTSSLHEEYLKEFDEERHRESIYRELEKLVDSGIVNKQYDDELKQFLYSLDFDSLIVDFKEESVKPRHDQD